MAGLSNEFFKILLPGIYEETLVRLPATFAPVLGARRDLKLQLASGEMMPLWDVQVFVNEKRDVYLDKGWKEFVRAHNLRQGYTLFFRYDVARGDLIVTVFDLTTCRKESLHAGAVGGGNSSRQLPIQELSEFHVFLKQSHLQKDYLSVPVDFQDARGWVKRPTVTLQMGGHSWTVSLKTIKDQRSGHHTSFEDGWLKFVVDNGLEVGDTCFFWMIRERSDIDDEDEEWEQEDEDDEHVLKVQVRKKGGTYIE